MCSDADTAKDEKQKKRKWLLKKKEITTNYDMPPQCVCTVTSFEGFVRNQPVILLSFAPLLSFCAYLCPAAKFCYF